MSILEVCHEHTAWLSDDHLGYHDTASLTLLLTGVKKNSFNIGDKTWSAYLQDNVQWKTWKKDVGNLFLYSEQICLNNICFPICPFGGEDHHNLVS